MKQLITLFSLTLVISFSAVAQNDTTEKVTKKGWKFGGALPAIAYDSDVGFRYGALTNFYDYGDGSLYPNYLRSLYLEWSRTTKGSGNNIITYDDKKFLGTNIRFLADISYLIEQSLDFYGFNGYQSEYFPEFADADDPAYITRMYYRHDRRMWRITTDFQGDLPIKNFKWLAGAGFYSVKAGSVDIDRINKGKDAADLLPQVDSVPGLYENYVNWGIIPDNQKNGGNAIQLKLGLVYDTRDNEANPMKGIWTEAFIIAAPSFLGNDQANTNFVLTHRQYFTLIPNRLSFVYRASYTQKLSGENAFYMLPFYYNSKQTQNAFGGSKTIRGVLRNRVVGDAVVFGNIETRWKALVTKIGSQDFYIALSAFLDGGRVTQRYEFNQTSGPLVHIGKENWHLGAGGGIRFALNENFIVAVDYGRAIKKEDGISGVYIGLNWLF